MKIFTKRFKAWFTLAFVFIQSTISFSQNPNCLYHYDAVYYFEESNVSTTECGGYASYVPYFYDAACEIITVMGVITRASLDEEVVNIKIKISNQTACPFNIIDLGGFNHEIIGDWHYFTKTITLTDINSRVYPYFKFQNSNGCGGEWYVEPSDKLDSQNDYYDYIAISFRNYSGAINSGSLAQAIQDVKVLNPNASCLYPQWFSVNGTFNVDVSNYCIIGEWSLGETDLGNEHITMSPGAEIIVKEGNTLTLKNELVTCCKNHSDRWKSITVESGATLIAINTTFDNGHYAINAMPGSTIIVSDCYFEDAYVGIYGSTNIGEGPSLIYVTGNSSFTFDGTFNSTYSGEDALTGGKTLAGIKAEDCDNVSVSYNGSSSPTFDNLQYGILLRNSNLYAVKAKFSNMTSGISQFDIWGGGAAIASRSDHQNNTLSVTGFGKNSTVNFNNLTFGVVNRGNLLTVQDNKMTNMYSCVDHKDTRLNATISSNRLEPFHVGLDLGLNTGEGGLIYNNDIIVKTYDDAIGIVQTMERRDWDIKNNLIESQKGLYGFLRSSSLFGYVHENTFRMKSTVADYYSGVKNENGGSINFYCNSFPSESSSTEAYGMLSSMSPTLYLTCNTFDSYRFSTGFINGNLSTLLRGTSYTNGYSGLALGSQTNQWGIIGDQPHHANTFNGGFSSYDAKCWGGATYANLSIFLINGGENSAYEPDNSDPSSDWFKPDGGHTSVACNTACPNGIGRTPRYVGPNDTETRLLRHPLTYEDYQYEQTWSLRFQIYELIKRGEIIPTEDTLLTQLAHYMDQGEEGEIMEVEAALLNLDTLVYENNSDNEDNYELLQTKHYQLDTLIKNNLDSLELIYDNMIALVAYIDSVQTIIDSSRLGLDTTIQQGLDELYTEFPEKSESTLTPKKNLVRALHFELKCRNGIALDSSEWIELIEMAELCPREGGKASYMASALIQKYRDFRISPDLSCEYNYQPLRVSNNDSKIQVSPNPSEGIITVSWIIKPENSSSKLVVFDIYGKELQSSHAERSIFGREEVNLSALAKGIYFLQLRDPNEGILDTKKIILH